jgi:hypothetical protein
MFIFLRAVAIIGMILGGSVFIGGIAQAISIYQEMMAAGRGNGMLLLIGIVPATIGLVIFLTAFIAFIILRRVLKKRR